MEVQSYRNSNERTMKVYVKVRVDLAVDVAALPLSIGMRFDCGLHRQAKTDGTGSRMTMNAASGLAGSKCASPIESGAYGRPAIQRGES
jgi:hypothetical protein